MQTPDMQSFVTEVSLRVLLQPSMLGYLVILCYLSYLNLARPTVYEVQSMK